MYAYQVCIRERLKHKIIQHLGIHRLFLCGYWTETLPQLGEKQASVRSCTFLDTVSNNKMQTDRKTSPSIQPNTSPDQPISFQHLAWIIQSLFSWVLTLNSQVYLTGFPLALAHQLSELFPNPVCDDSVCTGTSYPDLSSEWGNIVELFRMLWYTAAGVTWISSLFWTWWQTSSED